MDRCEEKYRCDTALDLLSMLAHSYNIIFDCSIGALGRYIEFIDGFNDTNKRLLSMLIPNLKLIGAEYYDPHM